MDAYYLCITHHYVHELYVFHVCALMNVLCDKLTNAHLSLCSITYYYSSPTCFGHSCDHHQGVLKQDYKYYSIIIKKCMLKPLGFL